LGNCHQNLVAQSRSGSVKLVHLLSVKFAASRSFDIETTGTLLAHNRQLVAQITDLLTNLIKFTDVKVSDLDASQDRWEGCHIFVSSLLTLENSCKSPESIDLSSLKMIVIDEVD